jgi:beta-alanine--pyruvate transaminase
MGNNRKSFGPMLVGVDHLPQTYDRARQAFSRGEPDWGAHLGDELERLVALHDASTIAAVIVEPVACSAGVLVPPKGYLKRLREICTKHGILLILDEVITAFGRLGTRFAADYFDVMPDLITTAKGLTSGAVPMGAVIVRKGIYDAFMTGPEHAVELFHGYTYSGHPLACAAGLAALEAYAEEKLFENARGLAPYWQEAAHGLKGLPHVIDIRNIGLVAAVELEPIAGQPAKRAFDVFLRAFETGLLIRTTGDIIALSPPLTITRKEVDEIFGKLSEVLRATA